jgi:hypothetical protein
VWDTTGDDEDEAEGWTLNLERRGGLLHLTQKRNKSEAESAPFCGARGSLEGDYVPAQLKPGAVRAWRSAGDSQQD